MWKLPSLETRLSISSGVDTEIIGVFQETGKKTATPKEHYTAIVDQLRKRGVFKAKTNSLQFIRFAENSSSENLLFIGLGVSQELTLERLRSIGGNVWSKLVAEKSKSAIVYCESFLDPKSSQFEKSISKWVRAFAEGLILNAYQFEKYKSKTENSEDQASKNASDLPSEILFLIQDKTIKNEIDQQLSQVTAIAEATRVTRDWSNEPSNFGTPDFYANEAKKLSRQSGLKVRVLGRAGAEEEKMGLFLGVAKGSSREGKLVILEYHPPKAAHATKTIALVGKGVTFDSGGISIKPSARMEEMKHDMTGAATVMGAILLAAKWKVPHRVIAVMAFTENMPDGSAIQPGNILTSRSGKTVEVINTDAEGRLILADALDFTQDFKPDVVIDVATLTGAVSIALGKHCCAVLGNDEKLIQALKKSGESCGEKIWELPLFDEYLEDLKSDYADLRNSANDSYGGTIRGAIFLKQFIRKGIPWAHLDIAATAYNVSHVSYFPKRGASGAYVRTLADFIQNF